MIMLLHSHQLQPVVQLQLLIMKTQQLQLESPVATSWVQLGCSFLQLLQLDFKRLDTV
jgi:hypothetical protein